MSQDTGWAAREAVAERLGMKQAMKALHAISSGGPPRGTKHQTIALLQELVSVASALEQALLQEDPSAAGLAHGCVLDAEIAERRAQMAVRLYHMLAPLQSAIGRELVDLGELCVKADKLIEDKP